MITVSRASQDPLAMETPPNHAEAVSAVVRL